MRYLFVVLFLLGCGPEEKTPPESLRDHKVPSKEAMFASSSPPESNGEWEGYDCEIVGPVQKCSGDGAQVLQCYWNALVFIKPEGIEHIDSEYICDRLEGIENIPEDDLRICVEEWKENCYWIEEGGQEDGR